jgi:hypothetical protein
MPLFCIISSPGKVVTPSKFSSSFPVTCIHGFKVHWTEPWEWSSAEDGLRSTATVANLFSNTAQAARAPGVNGDLLQIADSQWRGVYMVVLMSILLACGCSRSVVALLGVITCNWPCSVAVACFDLVVLLLLAFGVRSRNACCVQGALL